MTEKEFTQECMGLCVSDKEVIEYLEKENAKLKHQLKTFDQAAGLDEKGIEQLRKDNEIFHQRVDELNAKCDRLAFENELLKSHCRKINASTVINFASYILYYALNPESKMCVPNCVYEEVEQRYAKWIRKEYPEEEKSCNNCNHMLELLQAREEGKLKSSFCIGCATHQYENWEEIK